MNNRKRVLKKKKIYHPVKFEANSKISPQKCPE
jgi:hypothetical protein